MAVKITYAEVSKVATNIRTKNDEMKGLLKKTQTSVTNLDGDWKSDASETIRAKIEELTAPLEKHAKHIEEYAEFLDKAVKLYTDTDTSLNTLASKFQIKG